MDMSRTAELQRKLDDKHEFSPEGQARQWEGCGLHTMYVCGVCGLKKESFSGGQNSPDRSGYATADGTPLTLGQASRLECE
jgi:hypothetical protein